MLAHLRAEGSDNKSQRCHPPKNCFIDRVRAVTTPSMREVIVPVATSITQKREMKKKKKKKSKDKERKVGK
jgi:hypothetical protein